MREDLDCVQALVEAGADLAIRTAGSNELVPWGQMTPIALGSTCLHLAAIRSNIAIIQTLLQVENWAPPPVLQMAGPSTMRFGSTRRVHA